MDIAALGISVDSRSVKAAESDLRSMSSAGERAERTMGGVAAGSRQASEALDRQRSSASQLTEVVRRYAQIAAGAFSVQQIIKSADAWQGMQNRLRLVTASTQELAKATNDVFDIAQRTSSGMESVATVYQRFQQNANQLGLSLQRVAQLTEIVSKAVAVSGASAAAADAALMQFGQALAAGALRGEELNSILEQTPGLSQAIAVGMRVPIGALKDLAAEGKITGEVLVQALTNAEAFVDNQFATRVKTLGDSMTELGNATTRFIGEINQGLGATQALGSFIEMAARNLPAIATVVATLAAARLAPWLLAVGRAGLIAASQLIAAGTAVSTLGAAVTALAGGPVGLVITAIGLGAAAWMTFGSEANAALESTTKGLSSANEGLETMLTKFKELNVVQQRISIDEKQKEVAEAAREAGEALDALIHKVSLAEGTRAAPRIRAAFAESLQGIIEDTESTSEQMAQSMMALVDQMVEGSRLGEPYRRELLAQIQAYIDARSAVNRYSSELSAMQQVLDGVLGSLNGTNNALSEQQRALDEFMKTYATRGERMAAEIKKWDEALGGLSESQRRRITERFADRSSPTQSEADRLLKQIQDRANALNLEARAHEFLTDAQRELAAFEIVLQQTRDKSLKQNAGLIRQRYEELDALEQIVKAANLDRELREGWLTSLDDQIEGLHTQNFALADQIAHYGLAESQVMRLAAAEADEAASALSAARAKAIMTGATADAIAQYDEEIAKLRDLANVRRMVAGNMQTVEAIQAREDFLQEWERTNEQIGQSLTDALMRGFEDGKGFAENFRDTLKNLFNTLILRPMIQPVAQAGANAILGSLGMGGSGNAMGAAQGLGGVWNAFSGGLTSTLASGVGAIGSAIGSSALSNLALGISGKGATLAAGLAGPTTAGAGGMVGLGSVIGAAAPWIAGGLALYSMFGDSFKGETRFGGSFALERGGSTYYEGGPSGGVDSAASQFADALLSNAGASIQAAFAAVGSQAIVDRLMVGFESSGKGRGGTQSAGSLLLNGQVIHFGEVGKGTGHGGTSGSIEDMMRDAEIDVYQMAIKAWQAASGEFPAIMRDKLMGVSADSLGLEGAQSFIQEFVTLAQQLGMLSDALSALPFVPTIAATFDFAAALANAAGGAENAAAALGSFYANYYSEAERAAWLTEQLTAQFAELGMTLPQTRYEFRALVEANMALGEAGAQTVAALLGMESALSSLLPAFEAVTDDVEDLAAALNGAFDGSLATARALSQEAQRLLGLRTTGGNLMDRIDTAMGRSPMYAMQRQAELWAALQTASYDQQILLSEELTALVLERYQIETDGLSRIRDISRSLRDYLASLSTSELAPTNLATKVSEAERQLNEAVAKARAGDETALQQVQGLTQNALELWRRYGASGDAYQDAYYRITGSVADLANSAQSDAERQLAVSSDSLSQLQMLRGIAETATSGIDRQYEQAVAALAQETHLLSDLGQDTGRLHEIASLLGDMPAQIAAQLQPILSSAMGATVAQWYSDAGYGQGDAAGNAYWSAQLATNPAAQVQEDFLASLVTNWYRDDLGRDPDAGGLEYWKKEALTLGTQQAYRNFLASASVDGSHRNGLWSVPFDGYRAELHREEAVLPAVEARAWRAQQSDGGPSNAEVKALLERLLAAVERADNNNVAGHGANVQATRQSSNDVADAVSKNDWRERIAMR